MRAIEVKLEQSRQVRPSLILGESFASHGGAALEPRTIWGFRGAPTIRLSWRYVLRCGTTLRTYCAAYGAFDILSFEAVVMK
jgi:hypothetical protein